MSGINFDPVAKTLTITKGSRTVVTNAGKMVNLLPTPFGTIASPEIATAAFPDFPKDYAYFEAFVSVWNGSVSLPSYTGNSTGGVAFTRTPQEWSDTIIVTAAPDGADSFSGMVRLTRTTSPTHNWNGQTVDAFPGSGYWVPNTGSFLLEKEVPMSRAMTLYISGGNLVLYLQQSMAAAPGGYGASGSTSPTSTDSSGQARVYSSNAGFPVYELNASPYRKSSNFGPAFGSPSGWNKHWRGGADPCSTTDPTSYASTYQVEIAGQFGRRS